MTDHVAISRTRRNCWPLVTSFAVMALSVAAVDVFAQRGSGARSRPAATPGTGPASAAASSQAQRPAQAPQPSSARRRLGRNSEHLPQQAQQALAQGDMPPLIYLAVGEVLQQGALTRTRSRSASPAAMPAPRPACRSRKAAALIEPEGRAEEDLPRHALPSPLQLQYGT